MKSKELIENAIRSLYQLIMAVNIPERKGHIIDCNREFRVLSGKEEDFGIFCRTFYRNIHPEDRERFREFIGMDDAPKGLDKEVFRSIECRIRHEDRRYYWSEIICCNAEKEDRAGGDTFLLLIRDIHAIKSEDLRKEAEDRLILSSLQDRYDTLFEENMLDQQTGCYNRKGLKYYSELVLKEAMEQNRALFVCVADLNGLKYLNDTFGHAAGDTAISVVSSALKLAAPEGARIVRTGGDEFLIFASIDKDSPEPDIMGEKIQSHIKTYNDTHDDPYEVGVSYGWTIGAPEEGMLDLDRYIEIADKKMYEMKTATDKHRR